MRRLLLAVTGLSPQVVTETLYALCAKQPPWIPDEIHLMTSQEGADRARCDLLEPGSGQFHAFCRDYPEARNIRFSNELIHVITGAGGEPLVDIRTREDNALAADAIHALVRQLTADPDTQLHVSIAGGRKTMGFYLGYSLSMYARPQDKLSHVLVSAPFEGLPDFYFPPREGVLLHTRDNRPIHTADAQVMLAEIPFIRLRELLHKSAFSPAQRFSDVVSATQSYLEKARLTLYPARVTLCCGTREFHLQPQLFAFYCWLAERAANDQPPVRYTDADPEEFLRHYERVVDQYVVSSLRANFVKEQGFTKEFFERAISKINRALWDELPLSAAPYLIAPHGKRPHTKYGLTLAPADIQVVTEMFASLPP